MAEIALSQLEREAAVALARDLAVEPKDETSKRPCPFTGYEVQKAEAIFHRLIAQPASLKEDVANLVHLVDLAGATSSAEALGLLSEFRDMARRHPREFIEETGGDLARQT